MVQHCLGSMKKVPGLVRGSLRQYRSYVRAPLRFPMEARRESVLLVPGMFCPPSIMNTLGRHLDRLGFNVHVPGSNPSYLGPVANTERLETQARRFLKQLAELRRNSRVEQLWAVGHSTGGLVVLLAMDIARQEGMPDLAEMLRGVITLGTPFRGSDKAKLIASMLPVAKDLQPHAIVLQRIRRKYPRVILAMQAGNDLLTPPEGQQVPGIPAVVMDGFAHMDFLLGDPLQTEAVARLIHRHISRHSG